MAHAIMLGLSTLGSIALAATPPAARAAKLVAKMNLTEQITMLDGVWGLGWGPKNHPYVGNIRENSRLNIPWLSLQDGPQGYRDGKYGHYPGPPGLPVGTATQWPSGLSIAATWNRALARQWGGAMGAEFKRKGANVQLGPGLNLARVPVGGRNFEYMSGEDPYLGAALVFEAVKGIQSNGIIATAKHYILNNQEYQRGNMSSNLDERTLMEIYMPPFEAAVKAGVGAVMCGYNKINGIWACENPHTLQLLKSHLGFSGFVMSDWGACHSTLAAADAGLDQEMPGGSHFTPAKLGAAVANGSVTAERVSKMAANVLTSVFAAGIMDSTQPTGDPSANATSAEHAVLALQLATASGVLLKNEAGLLPLSPTLHLAVVGAAANCTEGPPSFGFGWPPTIGCVNSGGGSGGVVAPHVVSVLDSLRRQHTGNISYASGNDTHKVAEVAAAADVAVVVVGTTSSEGTDRPTTALPAHQLSYLRAVTSVQRRTVVVLMTPGAVAMGDWIDEVDAVLCFFLPGQAQGDAVFALLSGQVNPSGRLPVTMPRRDNEIGFTPKQYPGTAHVDGVHVEYSERLAVGYRWYHVNPTVVPAFCFGHGLSFTQFNYSELVVTQDQARFLLHNTGPMAGTETVQLYITFPTVAGEPPRQLRAFDSVHLKAGEITNVTLPLTARDFEMWDPTLHEWVRVRGEFDVIVGSSSCDGRISSTITFK